MKFKQHDLIKEKSTGIIYRIKSTSKIYLNSIWMKTYIYTEHGLSNLDDYIRLVDDLEDNFEIEQEFIENEKVPYKIKDTFFNGTIGILEENYIKNSEFNMYSVHYQNM